MSIEQQGSKQLRQSPKSSRRNRENRGEGVGLVEAQGLGLRFMSGQANTTDSDTLRPRVTIA